MIDSVHTDYCEHCMRAKAQGFKQLPYGKFLALRAEFYRSLSPM